MLKSVSLRDYLIPNPVKVRPEDSISEAIRVIIDNRVSGACVVDEAGNLLGILSELDCLRATLGGTYNRTDTGCVRDHMSAENLVVAHPDEDIVDVAQDMLANNRRRRPVVENGKLIGQITCRQLLRAVIGFQR